MNTLSIISKFIHVLKILTIVGAAVGIVFLSVLYMKGTTVAISSPLWEVISENSLEQTKLVLQQTHSIQIDKILLQPEVPARLGLSLSILITLLVVVTYTLVLLSIIGKIVNEVREQRPFTFLNAKRIKYLGILIGLIPIFKVVGTFIFVLWLNAYYKFEGLDIHHENSFSWTLLVIGLLIYVLGISFDHGVRLQEEQDLTV